MSVTLPQDTDNRFVTYTDWAGYLKYLDAVGESHVRVTYDRGKLELMSPGRKHEKRKSVFSALLETLMNHRRMRTSSFTRPSRTSRTPRVPRKRRARSRESPSDTRHSGP